MQNTADIVREAISRPPGRTVLRRVVPVRAGHFAVALHRLPGRLTLLPSRLYTQVNAV